MSKHIQINPFYPGKQLLWILPITFAMFLIYFPSIIVPYITHDDMNFWLEGNVDFLGNYYLSVGRFGSYVMLHLFDHMFDYHIEEFTFNIRGLLIFINSIGCFISFQIIKKYFSSIESCLLSICIFILPAVGGVINWPVVSGGIFSTPFALLSYIALTGDGSQKKKIILSLTLLQISLWTYPAMAAMFIVPAIFRFIFSKDDFKEIKEETTLIINIFLSSMLFYYVVTKFVLVPILKAKGIFIPPFNPSHTFDIGINLKDKILFFFQEIFTISNLWNIYPSKIWSWISLATISLGLFFYYRKIGLSYIKRNQYLMLQKTALLFLLLIITTIAFMAPPYPMSIYRAYLPSMAAYFIILYWSIKIILKNIICDDSYKKYQQQLVIIMFIPALFFSEFNNLITALNSNLEYNYIKAKISEHINQNKTLYNIHFVQIAPGNFSYIGYPLRGGKDGAEFNSNAVYEVFYGIVNLIFSEAAEKRITKKAHRETTKQMQGISYQVEEIKRNHSIKVTWSETPPTNSINDKETLIIDMNNLGFRGTKTIQDFILKTQ